MSTIFKSKAHEAFFEEHGYITFSLFDDEVRSELMEFYSRELTTERPLFEYAANLSPIYLSIYDKDVDLKKRTRKLVSWHIKDKIEDILNDHEVFCANFMIKDAGKGELMVHQDFNHVDETKYTAYNLWCPLVDSSPENGGLFIIPGSHKIHQSQRGANIPTHLVAYNELLKQYLEPFPLKKGQGILFDHRLIHYSSPNQSNKSRVAIHAVVKPKSAQTLKYLYDPEKGNIKAYKINPDYIIQNDIMAIDGDQLELDHVEELIPLPPKEVLLERIHDLKRHINPSFDPPEIPEDMLNNPFSNSTDSSYARENQSPIKNQGSMVLKDEALNEQYLKDGFVKLPNPLLNDEDIAILKAYFLEKTNGKVQNHMGISYFSLHDTNRSLRKKFFQKVVEVVAPHTKAILDNYRVHLGTYFVKVPGDASHTFPHQHWTFVDDKSENASVNIWIPLSDVDETNGTLGFVPGSHRFFKGVVGSPFALFPAPIRGHEDQFYEYLQFLPMKAGEAVVFDNRIIHGTGPNHTDDLRMAVAVGLIPTEDQLYHYYLMPPSDDSTPSVAKLKVDQDFFLQYASPDLDHLYENKKIPDGFEIESILSGEFQSYSREEIQEMLSSKEIPKNGRKLPLFPFAEGQAMPEEHAVPRKQLKEEHNTATPEREREPETFFRKIFRKLFS